MTPTRPIIVGESRQRRQAFVLGVSMEVGERARERQVRISDVFEIVRPVAQGATPDNLTFTRARLDVLRRELTYALKSGLPTHVLEQRIANAETILRARGVL